MKNVKVALAFVLALGSASLSGCSSVPENVSVEEETTGTLEESEEQGYDEIDTPDPDVYSSIPPTEPIVGPNDSEEDYSQLYIPEEEPEVFLYRHFDEGKHVFSKLYMGEELNQNVEVFNGYSIMDINSFAYKDGFSTKNVYQVFYVNDEPVDVATTEEDSSCNKAGEVCDLENCRASANVYQKNK